MLTKGSVLLDIRNSAVSAGSLSEKVISPSGSLQSEPSQIRVCKGKVCCKRGAQSLFETVRASGRNVSEAKCLGLCRNAPAIEVMTGGETAQYTEVTGEKVCQILSSLPLAPGAKG